MGGNLLVRDKRGRPNYKERSADKAWRDYKGRPNNRDRREYRVRPYYHGHPGYKECPYDKHRHYDYRGVSTPIMVIGGPGINGTGTQGSVPKYTNMEDIIANTGI